MLAWNGPLHQSTLLNDRTGALGHRSLEPLTVLLNAGLILRWSGEGRRVVVALDPSFPAAAELRALLRRAQPLDDALTMLSNDVVSTLSLQKMPITNPSRMRVEQAFSRNGSADRGRLLIMLEALGGDAPVVQLRRVIALDPASSRTIVRTLVKVGVLVIYVRGEAQYVRFSANPIVNLLRQLLSKLVSSRFEYAEARRHLRQRAVVMSGLQPLGDDWLERALDPRRKSAWFPSGRSVPPFFGPYARYQMLSLLATKGPLRRSDVARILKINFDKPGVTLERDGAVLTWRVEGRVYADIHPKHPARYQLMAFLSAVRGLWPALDRNAPPVLITEKVASRPPNIAWRGNLLELCGEENRTLALVLARLAGTIDTVGIELLGGYERATIGRGLRTFAQARIMRPVRTAANSLGYELDPEFEAYPQLVALIDAIVAYEPVKWEGRLRRLRSTRRRKAFEPAATTARLIVDARRRSRTNALRMARDETI